MLSFKQPEDGTLGAGGAGSSQAVGGGVPRGVSEPLLLGTFFSLNGAPTLTSGMSDGMCRFGT